MKLAYMGVFHQLVYWIACIIAKEVVVGTNVQLVPMNRAFSRVAVRNGNLTIHSARHNEHWKIMKFARKKV